jgi:hypothetical protein
VELAKMLEDAGMPAKTVYIGAAVPPKHLFMSKIINHCGIPYGRIKTIL